jgi:hypothetical protein
LGAAKELGLQYFETSAVRWCCWWLCIIIIIIIVCVCMCV